MVEGIRKTKISINVGKLKPTRQRVEIYTVVLLSLVLRLFNLGKESLWLDEVYSILYVTERYTTAGILFNLPLNEPHPPLYYLILNLWTKIFGKTEFVIRFPSAIFGVLAVGSTYLLGKKLFSHYAGLFSALMMSLSSYHIYYSQSARMYSLLAFLGTFSLYYMLCMIEDKNQNTYKKYITTTVLLAYTHVFGLFVIIIENVYIFAHKIYEQIKNDENNSIPKSKNLELFSWLKVQSLIGVLISPWLFILFRRVIVDGSGLSTHLSKSLPQVGDLVYAMNSMLILQDIELHSQGIYDLGYLSSVYTTIIILLAFLSVFLNVKEGENSVVPSKESLLASSIILVPLLGSFIISHTVAPIFNARYLIAGSVGIFLLLGYLIENVSKLDKLKNFSPYTALFLAVLVLLAISLPLPSLYLDNQNEKWKDVADDIDSLAEPRELLMINAYMGKAYNYHRIESNLVLKELSNENPSKEVENYMKQRQEAWLILFQADEDSYTKKISARNLVVSNVKSYEEIKIYRITKPELCLP